MARSARDLRLLLSIIGESQIPAQAPPAELKRLKVALWLDAPPFPSMLIQRPRSTPLQANARRGIASRHGVR
jgi:hypothetical protein